MASKLTNDRKRAEMKEIMAGVFAKGWKPNEVAAIIGVTASNISSWKAGKNMGTNAARAALMALPGRDTFFARDMMDKAVQREQGKVDAINAEIEKIRSDYEKYRTRAFEGRAFNIEHHGRELAAAHQKAERARNGARFDAYYIEKRSDGKSSYEWDIQYHTKALVEAQNQTDAQVEQEAKDAQEHAVAYQRMQLIKAQKYLDFVKKAAQKW